MLPEPDDLVEAGQIAEAALRPGVGLDWTGRAGDLDWDVETTILHQASVLTFYAVHLGSRSTRWLPVRLSRHPGAGPEQVVAMIPATARALAEVAGGAPPATRAYHPAGMADVSGFVAMGCDEVLVHTWDACRGLDLPFDPPEELCRQVLLRLFPWAPVGGSAWEALLWANGRADLPGHGRLDESWLWHCAPLDEWDGTVPRWEAEPASEYVWDERQGRWTGR